MLIKIDKQTNDFIYHFKRKFTNFCKKAPLLLSFEVLPDYTVSIRDNSYNRQYNFALNFSEDIKENINLIKKYLQKNWYPKFKVAIKGDFDIKSMQDDFDIDEIDKKMFHTNYVNYRIEKVIFGKYSENHELKGQNRNEVIVVDNREVSYLYRLKMPVLLFLEKIKTMEKENIYNYLLSNTLSVKELEKVEIEE